MNPEQKEAIEHGPGPLLVVAGPGAGKTRVITERIVHLLNPRAPDFGHKRLSPENILGLTFTEKAAAEMKARVRKALPDLATPPRLCTFHSFCYQTLRMESVDRRLLDKVDVWIFLRRRMAQLGLKFYQKLAEPGAFLHDLNEFFSRCQDELIEPEDFERYARACEERLLSRASRSAAASTSCSGGSLSPPQGEVNAPLQSSHNNPDWEEVLKKLELAQVFSASRRLLQEAGASSLGSLVSETVALWKTSPEVLERARERYRAVLVDEFQDTNYGQVELLKLLAGSRRNITAVGDDDQAIYRFRGASHGAFEMFDEAFPGHQTVYLSRNYRSTKNILRVAATLIARNDRYAAKPPLVSHKPDGCPVFLLKCPDARSEAFWIAGEIKRLARQRVRYGQMAVLYRAHAYRDLLVSELRRRKIPFEIRGLSLLSVSLLRDFLAYLKVIHSPHENISLTRILLAPRWSFPELTAQGLREAAALERRSLYEVMAKPGLDMAGTLGGTNWQALHDLLREFRHLAKSLPVTTLADTLADRLDWRFLPGSADAEYLGAFRAFLEAWEVKSETRRLDEFMEYFAYFVEAGGKVETPERESPQDAVQMMTLHAAKGLEFPAVFLISVAPRRFPATERKPVIEFPPELRKGPRPPRDIHLQEERRLFYVGITRAQDRLYVSSIMKSSRQQSVFISEMLSSPGIVGRDLESIDVPGAPESIEGKYQAPASEGSGSAKAVAVDDRGALGSEHGGDGLWPTKGAQSAPLRGQGRLFDQQTTDRTASRSFVGQWLRERSAPPEAGQVRLSATSASDYLDCPLKFNFLHLLKIPGAAHPALTFGNVMHRSVRHYFELRSRSLPSFEAIRDFYLENWGSAGFDDDYQEQTYRQAGLEQLRAFVERHNALRIDCQNLMLEQTFEINLEDVALEGRVDQIMRLDSTNGRRVELIDYKTGRPRTERDAEKSLQLSIYALAAKRVFHLDPVRLTFYNLSTNEPVSTVRTAKDLEGALEKIREIAAGIRAGRVAPSPGYVCRWCDFISVCPAHEE